MDRDEHTNTLHGLILGLWTPGLGEPRPPWGGRLDPGSKASKPLQIGSPRGSEFQDPGGPWSEKQPKTGSWHLGSGDPDFTNPRSKMERFWTDSEFRDPKY